MNRLLIVDDHPVFRHGLRQALDDTGAFGEIMEAGTGAEARVALGSFAADLVVIDIGLPDVSGLDIVEAFAREPKAPPFFVLTMSIDPAQARRAFRLGASGFASKSVALGTLVLALRLVLAGEMYVEGELLRAMMTAGLGYDVDERASPVAQLTDRERAVLDALLEGLNAKEAAIRLGVSLRTAENYQSCVYSKLGAKSPIDLVRIAYRAGIVSLS